MGDHGWIEGICQPWGQYAIQEMAGHSGSPWVSQTLAFHLSEAVGLQANHGVSSNSDTQVGTQNKDFSSVLQMDLPELNAICCAG